MYSTAASTGLLRKFCWLSRLNDQVIIQGEVHLNVPPFIGQFIHRKVAEGAELIFFFICR
jgi:hypothetical protein